MSSVPPEIGPGYVHKSGAAKRKKKAEDEGPPELPQKLFTENVQKRPFSTPRNRMVSRREDAG